MCDRRAWTRTVTSIVFAAALGWTQFGAAQTNEASFAARLAKIERSLDSRGLVDLLQQVDSLQAEVRRLQGQIEEQSYLIEQLRSTQRDTYVNIDRRFADIEQRSSGLGNTSLAPPLTTLNAEERDVVAGVPAPQSSLRLEVHPEQTAIQGVRSERVTADEPAPTAQAISTTSISAAAPTVDTAESEASYKAAFSLLKAGKYDESIAAFSGFLTQFPTSQYADNAQYWLGETYYVRREFEPAVAEYRKLIKAYPQSKKRSHAMLKIGYSFHELGRIDQARAVLEDLRNRYTGSTAARLAEDRIQRILAENSTP